MPNISNSKIINFPIDKIYRAVMDIESYPEILTFIRAIRILEKAEQYLIARVGVGLPMLNFSYDCRIEFEKNTYIKVALISGPFRRMNAYWKFEPLAENQTKVTYSLDTEFKNSFMELTAGALFASQINYSIQAFEERLKAS